MKKYLLLSFCLFSFSILSAQEHHYNFGKVLPAQLEMTNYELDTSASALILHDYGKIKVVRGGSSYLQIYTHIRRIKILKKGGLDQGDIEIPYYSYKNKERVVNAKAVVTLANGETYEFGNRDFFTEEKSKYWSKKKIALPKLEVGAVIDYYYKIESNFVIQPREWYFQTDIPIVLSDLTVDFNDSFSYMYLFQGFEGMEKTEEENVTTLRDSITEATIKLRKFTVKNVPALKTEKFITTIDDYRLRIRFQCTQYISPYGEVEEILSDWPTVTDKILSNPSFGVQYKKKVMCGKILKAAAPILGKDMPPLDKAMALYDFINDNIEANGISGIYVRTSLNEAFEKKIASKSEMNLMLLALLQKAEIEAFPLLISTRDNGHPMPKHPIVDQFNRTIIYAVINGKNYFVDQGNKLRPFGQLSRNSMNRKGFLLRKPKGTWLNIDPNKSKKIIVADFTLNEEGKPIGRVSANYTKIEASDNRWDWINDEKEKSWVEWLENTIIDFELDSVSVENERKLSKPFKVHFDGDFSGIAQDVGDFIYLNPFVFSDFSENPFESEMRQYPVDFPHPFSNQFIINIKYDTEDYKMEELPKDAKLELSGKSVTVRYAAQEKVPGWIQITYALSVNDPYFPVDAYSSLRSIFDITAEKLGEQVVLKKL